MVVVFCFHCERVLFVRSSSGTTAIKHDTPAGKKSVEPTLDLSKKPATTSRQLLKGRDTARVTKPWSVYHHSQVATSGYGSETEVSATRSHWYSRSIKHYEKKKRGQRRLRSSFKVVVAIGTRPSWQRCLAMVLAARSRQNCSVACCLIFHKRLHLLSRLLPVENGTTRAIFA